MNCDLCGFTFDSDFGSAFAIFNYTHHILVWIFFIASRNWSFSSKKKLSDLSKKIEDCLESNIWFEAFYYFPFMPLCQPNSAVKFHQNSIVSNSVKIHQKMKYFGAISIYSKPFQVKFIRNYPMARYFKIVLPQNPRTIRCGPVYVYDKCMLAWEKQMLLIWVSKWYRFVVVQSAINSQLTAKIQTGKMLLWKQCYFAGFGPYFVINFRALFKDAKGIWANAFKRCDFLDRIYCRVLWLVHKLIHSYSIYPIRLSLFLDAQVQWAIWERACTGKKHTKITI